MYSAPEWAAERERISEDLEAARRVHQSLMQQVLPDTPELGMAMAYRPAWHIGGDLIDVRRRGARVAVCVADVAGSGVQAALIAVAVRAWMDHVRGRFVSPVEVADQLNKRLCECVPVETFVTLAYLVLNVKTGEARWVVAGHELPLVRRAATGVVEEVRTTGPLLGVDPNAAYEEVSHRLEPGDVAMLYTDGLQGRSFHSPAIPRLAAFTGRDLQALVDDLMADATGSEAQDDVALIALQRR